MNVFGHLVLTYLPLLSLFSQPPFCWNLEWEFLKRNPASPPTGFIYSSIYCLRNQVMCCYNALNCVITRDSIQLTRTCNQWCLEWTIYPRTFGSPSRRTDLPDLAKCTPQLWAAPNSNYKVTIHDGTALCRWSGKETAQVVPSMRQFGCRPVSGKIQIDPTVASRGVVIPALDPESDTVKKEKS